MIVLQSVVNKTTLEVLCKRTDVTNTQLNLGCVSCR